MTDSEKILLLETKIRNLELEIEVMKLQKNQFVPFIQYPVYPSNPVHPYRPEDSRNPPSNITLLGLGVK